MKSKCSISWVVAVSLCLTPGCIHTHPVENKDLKLEASDTRVERTASHSSLQIESVIYNESKWPLSDFFSRLMAGEFKDAISKVDLRYVPSNTNNEILRELIDDGFVPVYVKVTNTSSVPVKVSESQFFIDDGKVRTRAIDSAQIPRMFKRVSSEAIAANILNVGAVVLAVAVLFYAIAKSSRDGNGLQYFDLNPSSSGGGSGDMTILNEAEKTTNINYRNYLLVETTIPPQSEVQGLLFFYNSAKKDGRTFRLSFEESAKTESHRSRKNEK